MFLDFLPLYRASHSYFSSVFVLTRPVCRVLKLFFVKPFVGTIIFDFPRAESGLFGLFPIHFRFTACRSGSRHLSGMIGAFPPGAGPAAGADAVRNNQAED